MPQYIELTEIIKEMRKNQQRMSREKGRIFSLAKDKARTERDYQIAKRQEILKLKSQGYAATLIPEMVRGSEDVAEKRFERDVARELYNSGRDSMRATQTEASLLQTISKYVSE